MNHNPHRDVQRFRFFCQLFVLATLLLATHWSMRSLYGQSAPNNMPVRVGIVGLVHDHVHGILRERQQKDIQIVGIVEPNLELARRYSQRYGFKMDVVYPTIDEMLDKCKPDAVTAFNSIFGHLEVVQKCAPLHIHVMVEKPLAINMIHAAKMAELARENQILLLTNFETTWYHSNAHAFEMLNENKLGPVRKIVIHDGHRGPKEIGCSSDFLQWLTDPKLNGGGAIVDFGCYGANLSTKIMSNARPTSVTAVTGHFKPDVYPNVDDEATIVLAYPDCQAIIQASWNWPFNRKDMEVYGQTGYAICEDGRHMRIRLEDDPSEKKVVAEDLESPFNDSISYLAAAVRGDIEISPADLSSLENNLIVVEILDAARESAVTGKSVPLK